MTPSGSASSSARSSDASCRPAVARAGRAPRRRAAPPRSPPIGVEPWRPALDDGPERGHGRSGLPSATCTAAAPMSDVGPSCSSRAQRGERRARGGGLAHPHLRPAGSRLRCPLKRVLAREQRLHALGGREGGERVRRAGPGRTQAARGHGGRSARCRARHPAAGRAAPAPATARLRRSARARPARAARGKGGGDDRVAPQPCSRAISTACSLSSSARTPAAAQRGDPIARWARQPISRYGRPIRRASSRPARGGAGRRTGATPTARRSRGSSGRRPEVVVEAGRRPAAPAAPLREQRIASTAAEVSAPARERQPRLGERQGEAPPVLGGTGRRSGARRRDAGGALVSRPSWSRPWRTPARAPRRTRSASGGKAASSALTVAARPSRTRLRESSASRRAACGQSPAAWAWRTASTTCAVLSVPLGGGRVQRPAQRR